LRALIRCQRGVVIPLAAITLAAMILVAALAVEVGAAILQREHMQTAVDAAALAGALNAEPWLAIRVDRSRHLCEEVPDEKGVLQRSCWWEYDSVNLTGRQEELVGTWPARAGCGSGGWSCPGSPEVLRRWVEFPADTQRVVEAAFWANAPVRADATIDMPEIRAVASSASVTVSASGTLRTRLLRLAGVASLGLHRSGRAVAQLRPLPWP